MQRWTAFLFAALVLGAGFWVAKPFVKPGGSAATVAKSAEVSTLMVPSASAPAKASSASTEQGDPKDNPSLDRNPAAGRALLSGEAVPDLPQDAPKSVVFGVILVQYKGAQGAPANARSREQALTLAKELAVEAKKDFKVALQRGDKGSIDNAGRIPRGMLEPAPEYVLFTLAKDQVSEPVDTPRGFWVVQRIE